MLCQMELVWAGAVVWMQRCDVLSIHKLKHNDPQINYLHYDNVIDSTESILLVPEN
jgi:hypothetical protein